MSIKDLTEPVHSYYDLEIFNNNTLGNTDPIPIRFTEARNNPFLYNPQDYYMSVVRFQISTGDSLPVFLPQVQLYQNDANLLIYSITLTYKNYEHQEFVRYVPDDLSQPAPEPPINGIQDITSSYYFVSYYQQWIDMINTTFKTCVVNLNAKVIAGNDTLPSLNPPFMEFDPQNFVAILDCDINGYDSSLANPIKLYMNAPMYNLFSTFPAQIQGYSKITNGKNVLIPVNNYNGGNILNLTTYNALQVFQEGSTIALMNPISAITFCTALLPIIPSNVATPKIFGSTTSLINQGNNANVSNIISDFVVPLDATNRYRPNIVYTPTAEYRLFSMTGNSPVSSIEITCYWRDMWGGLHPVYLNSGCGASLKLMFRRKDYNNITL